jgi:hypothetical protein
MIFAFIGWAAAFVAAITGLAMLQDADRKPVDTSLRGWFRHSLRLSLLIGITAAAALLTVMPEARTASAYEVALRCGLTGLMAMQSPCPWWRYVFKGQGAARIDRRRVL